jgi:glycosyltransferase involved in cell wall biosynthesis
MKISFLSDSVYPYNKGGKETRSYELAEQLAERGHEVNFYTMGFWGNKPIKKLGKITFHRLCKNYLLYNNKRRSIKQAIIFGFASFKLFKEDFDVLDADHMVYFHLFPAKLACLIKRKPLVITWHEVWGKEYWQKYMGKKGIIGYIMEKLSSKLPNKIISISKLTTSRLVKELGVKKEKIYTIPNAINHKKIQNLAPAKETSDIIFVGRLLGHKNIDVLIKAVNIVKKSNKNIKCIIIGDGPEKENLENLSRKLNLEKNIIFKGVIPKTENIYRLMKSSKVFVLPSTREGFGITVIEANSCGIPVITISHKDNAAKSLIRDGKNGFVCKLDEKEMARTIEKAMAEHKGMKRECINSAKQYDWSNIIKQFEEVYEG